MNLEKQVCSLELSKELKISGVKQNGFFWWFYVSSEKENSTWQLKSALPENIPPKYDKFFISAFTASELMELLPIRIIIIKNEPFNCFRLRIEKSIYAYDLNNFVPVYLANYRCDSAECTGENAWLERTLLDHNCMDENFANCLAKLLIVLLEKGYIKNE